ncbi:MAG: TonB-dependent receptor plug domain-containing protein, partial [Tannerellaceae bacterium]
YVGYKEQILDIDLHSNTLVHITLEEGTLLDEVVVLGDLNSPIHTTQTGKISLSPQQLNTEYALFSSPDLIKTLQNIPGVAPGTDLISGLFVRGGTNDGNLFLLDGTPLYQVNHVGGLFSSFNTDVIKNVDFYKSGFPARYGGRTSSVVDVRTRDGNAKEFHGLFSIGLLDGRALIEGPIIKERTSFIVGMRRSWADALMALACGITNLAQDETKLLTRFAFHDLNAKITHKFSDRSKAYLSFYSGNDALKTRADQFFEYSIDSREEYQTRSTFSWGNHTVSANWNYQLSAKLFSNFSAVYSRNNSLLRYSEKSHHFKEDNITESVFQLSDTWKSTI